MVDQAQLIQDLRVKNDQLTAEYNKLQQVVTIWCEHLDNLCGWVYHPSSMTV